MLIATSFTNTLADRIDAWLPQTQCTQCGYPRCRAYAEAVACGAADINQCPPGGEATITALALLQQVHPKPLDPRYGQHLPRQLAVIDEAVCIGCRKCLDVCPVDAILGARKKMHTVLARDCSGCELCLPSCPVDCITMVPNISRHARSASGSKHTKSPLPQHGKGDEEGESSPASGRRDETNEDEDSRSDKRWPEYTQIETERWRDSTERRLQRMQRRKQKRLVSRTAARQPLSAPPILPNNRAQIRAEIQAAVERRRKKKWRGPG